MIFIPSEGIDVLYYQIHSMIAKKTILDNLTVSIIGLLFTFVCLISTFTFIIPILTLVFPGILEMIFSLIFGDSSFQKIGISVIITLLCVFLLSTYFFLQRINKRPEKLKIETIYYFVCQIFLLPPICFYFSASRNWESAGDGQFFFGIFEVFPKSCLSFLVLGIIIDLYRMMIKSN